MEYNKGTKKSKKGLRISFNPVDLRRKKLLLQQIEKIPPSTIKLLRVAICFVGYISLSYFLFSSLSSSIVLTFNLAAPLKESSVFISL